MPIGLLKLASYYRKKGYKIRLANGNIIIKDFQPDKILITSIFTYWAKYVKESVQFYRTQFPNAKIIVGGIYASLMPEHCKTYTQCDKVFVGVHKSANLLTIYYSILLHPIR
jgi:radical SAM superfamily enzyme YgiQ (UPF0313 family)